MTVPLSVGTADALAAAVAALLRGGRLRLYDGPQPVTPDADPSPATMLAEVAIEPAGAPAAGVLALRAKRAVAVATGRASWFRAVGGDGRAVFDGAVGRDLMLNMTTIVAGASLTIGTATVTVPR